MRVLGMIGVGALGVATGTLAALAFVKLADDRHVDAIWRALEQTGDTRQIFTEALVADLPDPARRYFLHAIRPGTPIASRIHWRYTGTMKPSQQMPELSLSANQIIAAQRGFVWKTVAHKGPLVVTAADYYCDGDARMRISLFGLIPVINATGPDLARSGLGRLLVESIAIPASLLPGPNVQIEPLDESHFRAVVNLRGELTPITIAVDAEGCVKQMMMPRWGDLTDDGHFEYIPYGATVEEERTFGGYTIPSRIRVAWWYGTDRYLEQIRLSVVSAELW